MDGRQRDSMQVGVIERFVVLVQRELLVEILGHRSDMALPVSLIIPFGDREARNLFQNELRVDRFDVVFSVSITGETPACAAGRPHYCLIGS